MKGFLEHGFCPTVIRKGRKILVIEIKALGIRFLTSNAYLTGNEYTISEQFDIKFDSHFIPNQLIHKDNFDYEGIIPKLKYFLGTFDSNAEKEAKIQYVSKFGSKQKWNFRKEIIGHFEQKIWLLTVAFLKFMSECFEFQLLVNNSTENILNPVSYPLCSISGFTYKLLKIWHLNSANLYVIKNEFHTPQRNTSRSEHEYVSLMEHKFPETNFIAAFTCPSGQIAFKEACPDMFDPDMKKAYFFNGCAYHAHYNNCLFNPKANANSKYIFGDKTYKEVNDEFDQKMTNLLLNNSSKINEVIIQWECNFHKQKLMCEDHKFFFSNHYIKRPLTRMNLRDVVRGAFFDVYSLKFNAKTNPNSKIYFQDCNGLYSAVAINNKYMTGKYSILIGKSVNSISIKDNMFYYKDKVIMGVMFVQICPPKNLKFPFLLHRKKNGQTVNTLCALCADVVQTF